MKQHTDYRYLQLEAAYLRAQVAELTTETTAQPRTRYADNLDADRRIYDARCKLRDLYSSALDAVTAEVRQAQARFDGISGEHTREAAILHYLDGLPWMQTALRLDGRSDTAEAVRAAVRRALARCGSRGK